MRRLRQGPSQGRPIPLLLDLDPRIDLTKPIYEQVFKLEARGRATAAGEESEAYCRCRVTDGLLLDSNILLWLQLDMPLDPDALVKIAEAKTSRRLFGSDISIWEIGVAVHNESFERRPNLQGLSVKGWFQKDDIEVRYSSATRDIADDSRSGERGGYL